MSQSQESEPAVRRAYQALGREEPPAWLERKVRDFARAEVSPNASLLSRTLAMRFGWPLAVTAVAVLSFSLAMVISDEPEMRELGALRDADRAPAAALEKAPSEMDGEASRSRDEPAVDVVERRVPAESWAGTRQAAAPRAPQAGEGSERAGANVALAPIEPPRTSPAQVSEAIRQERVEPQTSAPALPAATPAPAAKPSPRFAGPSESTPAASDAASSAADAPDRARQATRAAEAAARPQLEASKRVERDDHGSPERWLEHVLELRRQGRDQEARESLDAFRKRYPEHPIPEALREVETRK